MLTNYPNGVSSFGIPIYGGGSQVDYSGTVYFVDGNSGKDTNDGLSWEKAKKTLAVAFALSHADIARGSDRWARRNTIFIAGDAFDEDLVALPQKTDIIGVGSYNSFKGAGIIGNHVPVNSAMGVRFYNCHFRGESTGGDMFTLASAYSLGIEFHGCTFHADGGTAATAAIVSTAVRFLKIEDCVFEGAFSDATIELGAGNSSGTVIKNNIIEGANNGIEISASATSTPEASYIIGNTIKTSLICINDASSKFQIIDNRGVTLDTKGSSLAGAVVGNVDLSVGNLFSASDENNVIWPANGSI